MENKKALNSLGRKGKKDHLWLIIKDYMHKVHGTGYKLEEYFVFDRPKSDNMHEFLKKAQIVKMKAEAKLEKKKFKKPKFPKRFEIEDYFDEFANYTYELNKNLFDITKKNKKVVEDTESFRKQRELKRKRFVVLFKVSKGGNISDWNAIEIEIIRKITKDGKNKDSVVLNGELDKEKEFLWLKPLLDKNIAEKEKSKNKRWSWFSGNRAY